MQEHDNVRGTGKEDYSLSVHMSLHYKELHSTFRLLALRPLRLLKFGRLLLKADQRVAVAVYTAEKSSSPWPFAIASL